MVKAQRRSDVTFARERFVRCESGQKMKGCESQIAYEGFDTSLTWACLVDGHNNLLQSPSDSDFLILHRNRPQRLAQDYADVLSDRKQSSDLDARERWRSGL